MSKRSRQRQRATNRLLARGNGHQREQKELALPLPLTTDQEIVHAIGNVVERATDNESKQPRFTAPTNTPNVFASVYRFVKLNALKNEPTANATMRAWDAWLREFVKREPYLIGVLNSVIQIDKNRHWTITGGKNQVRRYTEILRFADEGAGWRAYCGWQAQSYYTTRMGFVSETGREGEGGPLRALWSVDPVAVELTGNPNFPLKYFPQAQSMGFGVSAQEWTPEDYFRGASLSSTDERDYGYGFPAIARAYDLAMIMVAVYEHDKEELGARAPRGLLLLRGISEAQWDDAMQARNETLDGLERAYFGGVATLASLGGDEISATLVALSQLPKGFNLELWTSMLLYGYALAFGYDAREFYPVSGGQLGTATETEVMHRKASSKGDLDFSLAHQEQIQNQLPPSLLFEYEQRDVEGEIADTQAAKIKAELITEVTKWVVNGVTVLTPEQVLQLAAQHGVIPDEWTPEEEDVSATDTNDLEVDRLRSLVHVQRAVELFPDEPIVQYEYPSQQERVIIARGRDLYQRRSYNVGSVTRSTSTVAAKFRRDVRALVREHCR